MTTDTLDYKDTLFLPRTGFPMRAGLPDREPGWLARWERLGIYARLRASAAANPGARLAAASTVIVSDPVAERRELAMKLGATHAIDPTTDDVVSACMDLTEHGVDYAFDAAGRNALIETGINATRFGGTTVG
mgnify:CR=1 FL=1